MSHSHSRLDGDLADVAFTLQVGRRTFPHRRTVVFDKNNRADLVAALQARDPARVSTTYSETSDRAVVFLFSGQGTQYVEMGADLYRTEPAFREHMDECAELLKGQIGLDLRSVLYPDGDRQAANERLTQTELTQPALFALEYSLARVWMEWGISPRAMVGHSIGEYVAACIAGVMTLPEALSVVSMRGRLMGSMPGGSMLAVALPEGALQPVLNSDVSLGAVNAPSMSVLSGPAEAIDALEQDFAKQNIACRKLHTSHAFHSSMMDPVLVQFIDRMGRIKLQPPRIPYLSNLTGSWMTAELATDPAYWGHHLRQTVRFADNLCEVMAFPDLALLEIGPGQTLGLLARQQGSRSSSQLILASLPGPQEKDQVTDSALMTWTMQQLWLGGVRPDWNAWHAPYKRRRVPLPTYPFERQRYWLGPLEEIAQAEPTAAPVAEQPAFVAQTVSANLPAPMATAAAATTVATAAASTSTRAVDDWIYAQVWKPALNPAPARSPDGATQSWLIFADEGGLASQLALVLEPLGCKLNLVVPGLEFARLDSCYQLRPGERADYDALAQDLKRRHEYPSRVLHLWSTSDGSTSGTATAVFDAAQGRSFYSIIFLSQALAKANASAPVQIGVVTQGLHSVLGDEQLRSNAATILGACKVISQEYPHLRCRNIDIVESAPRDAQALIREMTEEPFQAVVAYRHGRRWIEDYEPVLLERPSGNIRLLKDGGVYLITGGLGNIGLLLAETISEQVKAKFVLVGRSPFPERGEWEAYLQSNPTDTTSSRIRKLLKLESNGSEVMLVPADVASLTQMRAVIKKVRARWGAVDGVIHGAAQLSPEAFGPVGVIDRAAGDAHFRPKAHGLLVLGQALRNQPVQFWFLLSSLSAPLGGLGLACYAASNAYLDAAARQHNQARGSTWITVNWDSWTFAPGQAQANAIGPAEGQDCFRRIMASSLEHVVVSTTPLADRLAQWVHLHSVDKPSDVPSAVEASQAGRNGTTGSPNGVEQFHARPSLSTQYASARTDTEKAIVGVWEHLLGVSPIGIHDKFFELGGHSLLAVQLLARLREIFDLDLPVQRIFEAPTVAQLAEGIDQQVRVQIAPADSEDPSLAEMLKLVEGLSEEEMETLLKEAEA